MRLLMMVSKAFCCASPHENGVPFFWISFSWILVLLGAKSTDQWSGNGSIALNEAAVVAHL